MADDDDDDDDDAVRLALAFDVCYRRKNLAAIPLSREREREDSAIVLPVLMFFLLSMLCRFLCLCLSLYACVCVCVCLWTWPSVKSTLSHCVCTRLAHAFPWGSIQTRYYSLASMCACVFVATRERERECE